MMPRSNYGALFLALSMYACLQEQAKKEEVAATQPDRPVAVPQGEIYLPKAGLSFWLAPSWTQRKRVPMPKNGVQTLFSARRLEDSLLIPPRLEVTIESAPEGTAKRVFRHVMKDLRRLQERPGVHIDRAGFSMDDDIAIPTANIHLRYRVEKKKIVHRSVLVLQSNADAKVLVTFTITYLDNVSSSVKEEVESILDRIRVSSPERGAYDE